MLVQKVRPQASDTATVRLYAATKLEGKTRRQRPDLQWKDEPGNRLVDAGGVLGTWVERREPPDMDIRYFALYLN